MKKIAFVIPPHCMKQGKLIPSHHPIITTTLAGVARKYGAQILVIDTGVSGLSLDTHIEQLREFAPDWVGVIPFEYRREMPLEPSISFIQQAKKRVQTLFGILNCPLPNTLLLSAQGNTKNTCMQVLQEQKVDFVVFGDSEEFVYRQVCHDQWDGAGLSHGFQGNIVHIAPIQQINWQHITTPAWDCVDITAYLPSAHRYKKAPVFPIFASRSCPFGCDFCPHMLYHSSDTHSMRPVDDIMVEIQELQEKYHAENLEFYDPTFGVRKDHTIELCRRLQELPQKISWSCFSRTDIWDAELLQEMRRAGCHSILFGVESGNPTVLKRTKKGIYLEQVEEFVQQCHSVGIDTIASFIIGLPLETKESIQQTIQFAQKINPTYAQFHQARAFFAHEDWQRLGQWSGDWTETSASINGVAYIPNGFSQRDIEKQLLQAYLRFYMRPPKVFSFVKTVRHRSDIERYALGIKQLLHHFTSLDW